MSAFTRELRTLARLLSQTQSLPGPPIDTHYDIDWEKFKALVEYNKLGAYLAARLTESQLEKMPEELQLELKGVYSMESREAMVRTTSLRRMLDLLEGKVDVVALKGAALTWSLYDDAAERSMGDADLLVRGENGAERARDILTYAGFTMDQGYTHHHHLAPLTDSAHSLAIELHTNFTTPPLRSEVIDWLWEHTVNVNIKGVKRIQVLDPIGQLFHHCIHALNDPVDSPLVRDLFEIAVMVQRMSSQMQQDFVNRVKSWNMLPHVARAIYLAHRLFGCAPIAGKPAFGALDFWCMRSLYHTEEQPPILRIESHLARQHIEAMHRGAGNRNPFPPILISGDILWGHLEHTVRALTQRVFPHPKRPDYPHRSIGQSLLIHNTDTSEVQLLNQLAAAVWTEADGKRSARQLVKHLDISKDIQPNDTRLALRSLYQSHLLHR